MDSIVLNPNMLPLENTCLLLVSGVFVTYAHHSYLQYFSLQNVIYTMRNNLWDTEKLKIKIINDLSAILLPLFNSRKQAEAEIGRGDMGLELTCVLGILFLILQMREYLDASFSISDNVYGSTFFVMTGFHGLHVLVGVSFLLICQNRFIASLIAYKQSTGLECAIWYWHFVDVVWLFLFISVYWWGNFSEVN
jgi:heme/copper-type cytochrome/quinol oxidase subunit 3